MIFKKAHLNNFYFLPLLIFIAVFITVLSGCSDSIVSSGSADTGKYKALTESRFNSNAAAYAEPGAVVYVDLENLNAPPDSVREDTGAIGEDVIPYKYTETATHRIKLDASAMFKARLVSEAGAVIYQLNAPGDTARVSISAGNYKLYLTSTVSSDGAYGKYGKYGLTQPVFIQPDSAAIASGAGAPPQGGYDPAQLNQLLTTKKCISCNLNDVVIIGKDLSGANLTNAWLSGAVLSFVNFSQGNFNYTVLQDALVTNCDFKGVSFNQTVMNGSKFALTDFSGVNMQKISWVGTGFSLCDFRRAGITGGGVRDAVWNNSDLSGAVFSDVVIDLVTCKNTKMIGTRFSNVQLLKVDFKGAVMDSLKLSSLTFLFRCDFRGNRMRYAEFTDLRQQVSFFENCDLTGAKIKNSELPLAVFRGANLSNSVWNNVTLDEADMCGTNRTGAVFTDIRYVNGPTCWP